MDNLFRKRDHPVHSYPKRLRVVLSFFLFIFVSITSLTSVTTPVIALSEEDYSFYNSNGIRLFDADSTEVAYCGEQDPSSSLVGADNLEKIYNYFIGKGLDDYLAAATVGNIAIESRGDPTKIQGGETTTDVEVIGTLVSTGQAYGIIQWDPGIRVITYFNSIGTISGNVYDLEPQLELVWWHMNNTTPPGDKNFLAGFKNTKNVEDATIYFRYHMERAWTGHDVERIAAAKLALSEYGGNTPAASIQTISNPGCSGSVDNNLIQTVLNYTQHEYHPPNYFTMTDAYKKAIDLAIANGEYVGGGPYPGIDCGGFVTRVMRDSGIDPDYNSAQGNTDAQLAYLENSPEYVELTSVTPSELEPGDIAIRSGHTYMYVGQIDGFETTIASASISYSYTNWRAPMAGKELPADPNYQWFRKVDIVNV